MGKPSVPTTWQGTWLGMQPAQALLSLLGVLLLHHQQHVQGAALDLAAPVRQYEDQVLGRQVALGEDEEAPEDPGAVGQPVEVHGWDSGLKLGQVSAVDVNQNDDPVVFHRGPVVWNGKSFDSKNRLFARKEKPIQVDTILTLDANKGKVISSFGKDIFYMPHGLAVAGVAFYHLVGRLEAGVGDLGNAELLVVSLLSRDDWSVGDQREVDPGVGDQVGLELRQVNVESTVEPQRGCD